MMPITKIGHSIFGLINLHGQIAVFILLLIEEAGVPLPISGDLILIYAGYLIGKNHLHFPEVVFWSTLAVVLGASFLFWLIRYGGRPFVQKYGKYFLLPPKKVTQLEKWFTKKEDYAVLVGRFIPGIRVLLSAVAGLFGLRYRHFLPQIVAASLVWILGCLTLGYYLGDQWADFANVLSRWGFFMLLLFIISIIVYWQKNKKT